MIDLMNQIQDIDRRKAYGSANVKKNNKKHDEGVFFFVLHYFLAQEFIS